MDTLAIDPGLVTGWAMFQRNQLTGQGQVDGGRFQFYNWFEGIVDGYGSMLDGRLRVVCEDFIISDRTVKSSRQPDPHRIIGYLEGRCHELTVEFYLQTPAAAKSFCTDTKLRALGWYSPTPGGHANDATRHLVTFLVGQRDEPARQIQQQLVDGLHL